MASGFESLHFSQNPSIWKILKSYCLTTELTYLNPKRRTPLENIFVYIFHLFKTYYCFVAIFCLYSNKIKNKFRLLHFHSDHRVLQCVHHGSSDHRDLQCLRHCVCWRGNFLVFFIFFLQKLLTAGWIIKKK